MKFESILNAALILVESEINSAQEQLIEFASKRELIRFLTTVCRKKMKTSIESKKSVREINSAVCEAARTMYLEK